MPQRITVAHSPDADDAFMFYALATGKIGDPDLEFVHVLEDIQTLNERAFRGEYEVSAVSFHAYAYLSERYALLPHGASMGDGYGPMIVAREPMSPETLRGKRIAVPGKLTTAVLALGLWRPGLDQVVIPFDQIPDAVLARRVDAGLIIHEGQVTFRKQGLHKIIDLGEWWGAETGLPLPLGGNAIRKDLGVDLMRRVSRLLRESIQYGLAHREDALVTPCDTAATWIGPSPTASSACTSTTGRLDYGARGREAVRLLLQRGHAAGILPQSVEPEFAD